MLSIARNVIRMVDAESLTDRDEVGNKKARHNVITTSYRASSFIFTFQ